MTIAEFWKIIDKARKEGDGWEDMYNPLIESLAKLSTRELMLWQQMFDEYQLLSYKNKLWAAAYVINGGCSDDGFDYFRGWLTAQGRKVFMNALADPESLSKVDACEEDVEFEDMLSAAADVYMQKIGSKDYDLFFPEMDKYPLPEQLKLEMAAEIHYASDIDVEWEEDDLPKLLPKLCKAFDW